MDNEILEQIGLNQLLVDLYKSIRIFGPLSVLELSKILRKPRTTVHQNVSTLINKGLVYKTIRGTKKLLIASDPSKIWVLVEEKKIELKNEKAELIELKNLLPNYLNQFVNTNLVTELPATRVEYYEGKDAVLRIHDLALESGEVRAYVDGKSVVQTHPGNNFKKFWAAAESEKAEIWDIFMDSKEIQEFINKNTLPEKYHIKILPSDINISAMDYLIFADSIAIIQGGNNPNVVHIKNKLLHDNAKALHNLMWRLL